MTVNVAPGRRSPRAPELSGRVFLRGGASISRRPVGNELGGGPARRQVVEKRSCSQVGRSGYCSVAGPITHRPPNPRSDVFAGERRNSTSGGEEGERGQRIPAVRSSVLDTARQCEVASRGLAGRPVLGRVFLSGSSGSKTYGLAGHRVAEKHKAVKDRLGDRNWSELPEQRNWAIPGSGEQPITCFSALYCGIGPSFGL